MRCLAAISIILLFSSAGFPETIKVPDDYPSIKQAVEAAVDKDTVLVAPGTYTENIDFLGKAITLRSTEGYEVTTIDGEGAGSTVRFRSNEGVDSKLIGFTITNGTGTEDPEKMVSGGGIYCEGSSPMIRDNLICSNSAIGHGGGIGCVSGASPRITFNIVMDNISGMFSDYGWGGGIGCKRSSPVIERNFIFNNSTEHGGGGIFCKSCPPGYPVIAGNIIVNNRSSNRGGGMYISLCESIQCNNNLINSNTASVGGGIHYSDTRDSILSNNTIYGNSAVTSPGLGGGVYCQGGFTLTIIDTILWRNSASSGKEIFMHKEKDPAALTIGYSDVEGGKSSVHKGPGVTLRWEKGMMDADPAFMFHGPAGFYYLSHLAAGQPIDSPCVDAGSDKAGIIGMDGYWTRTDLVPDSGMVDMGFHYGPLKFPALQADIYGISESTRGAASFLLLAGRNNAHRNYILLGSITGTDPGIPLPGGKAVVPLCWDFFTSLVIQNLNTPAFSHFMGTLDGVGSTNAVFDTLNPIPGGAGVTLHFAFALNDPWDFVSNPMRIDIVP